MIDESPWSRRPIRVDGRGDQIVSQRAHGEQRVEPGGVAEVVVEPAGRERRARRRLDSRELHAFVRNEGKADATEVGAAAARADRVVGVVPPRSVAEGVNDCGAEGSGMRGVVDPRGCHAGSPRLHQHPAVGLLLERRSDHEHHAFEAVQGGGERQRPAPLACTGLGGQPGHPPGLVVVGLGYRGIGFEGARGCHGPVLAVHAGRGAQRLLEAGRPYERGWTPPFEHVEDGPWNVDRGLRRRLLRDDGHQEERGEVLGADGIVRARVQR